MIGDSVFAGTTERYGGEMCRAIVPLGWQVEVDAEPYRYLRFATAVLNRRLDAGWDAAVILLGNNYDGEKERFLRELTKIVERLSPRPIVLFTLTEPGYTLRAAEVNDAIREVALLNDNVILVDWAEVSVSDPAFLVDEVHPSLAGKAALVELVAAVLGPAPSPPGKCLETEFKYPRGGTVPTTTVESTTPTTTTTESTNGPTTTLEPTTTDAPTTVDPTTTESTG